MLFVLRLLLFCLLFGLGICQAAEENKASLLTFNFQRIDVVNLLHLLAEYSGKNIIISPKVHGNLSLHLKNVNWRDALDLILAMSNLTRRESAGVIYIVPNNDIQMVASSQSRASAVLSMQYVKAADAVNILKPFAVLSHTGALSADVRSNTVLIEDAPDRIAEIRALSRAIDIPLKQVMIAARIVSVDEDFTRELGLKFGSVSANDSTTPATMNVDLDSAKIDPGHFELTLARLGNDRLLDMELAAVESEGRGKVISSPKLLTADRKVAYIESGAEIPYQEKASHGATNVAFKKAVLSLKVKPEIILNNKMNLILQLSQDKVSQLTVNGVPAIDTRKIQTQVAVNNGETIVLGGIYEWANSESVTKVPFLGEIPVVGSLFKNKENKKQRKELLIFVTPTIVG